MNIDPKFIIWQVRSPRQAKRGAQYKTVTRAEYDACEFADKRKLGIMPRYYINVKRWTDRTGNTEYSAELCDSDSHNVMFRLTGYGSASQWEYDMRDAIPERVESVMMRGDAHAPTVYFREICNVPYSVIDVPRKGDL